MNPNIAVIILNWNGEKLLRRFLTSVITNTPASIAKVIVADNGSTDNSVALLKAEFPSVEILAFPENYGFAQGYNRAIEDVADRFEYVVLLNSDVETPPQWIEPLAEAFEKDAKLGACQPKILDYNNKNRFEYAGASGGFIDRNGFPYCRGRIFSTVESDYGQYDTPIEIDWATGACLMIRSKLYVELGGLDADFFAHMEEIDLCWRIRLAGYCIKAIPTSKVYHLGGGSLPAGNPRKTYLNFRNNLLMLHKNLPKKHLRSALLRRRLLDTLAWAKFLMTFDFANAAAVWRAHRHFSKMRGNYCNHPDVNLLIEGRENNKHCAPNILVEYYLHGHKEFSTLP